MKSSLKAGLPELSLQSLQKEIDDEEEKAIPIGLAVCAMAKCEEAEHKKSLGGVPCGQTVGVVECKPG